MLRRFNAMFTMTAHNSPMDAALPQRTGSHGRASLAPEYRVAAGICMAMAMLCALAFLLSPLSHDWRSLGPIWAAVTALIAAGAAVQHAHSVMVGRFLQSAALFFLVSFVGLLAGVMLATTALPPVDAQLARWDHAIGFDWLAAFSYWQAYPGVLETLSVIYASLSWQPIVLIGLLAAAAKPGAAGRFLAAWAIALALCMAIFPFTPAYGNFVVHGIDPSHAGGVLVSAGWSFADGFTQLREGQILHIDLATLDGVVTFPSFHTAGAIVLAAGFAHLRRLAWPMCLLNAAMVVSAVFIGAHYLVDVLAGIAIALIALILADRLVSERFDDGEHHDQRGGQSGNLIQQA